MATHLSFADYSDTDWGHLLLSEDWSSLRTFWAATLQFAIADRVDAVWFCPDLDDGCLFTQIGNKHFELVPPPAEYRAILYDAIRKMAAGPALSKSAGTNRQSNSDTVEVGIVSSETPNGSIQWQVTESARGLCLQPIKLLSS